MLSRSNFRPLFTVALLAAVLALPAMAAVPAERQQAEPTTAVLMLWNFIQSLFGAEDGGPDIDPLGLQGGGPQPHEPAGDTATAKQKTERNRYRDL